MILVPGVESAPSLLLKPRGSHEEVEDTSRSRVEDVSTGARFGRPAVVDVIAQKSRKARIQGAKEQIAGLCQEILGDPENSVWVSSAVPRHIGA